MKISELVAALEKAKEEYGDLEVAYYDNDIEEAGYPFKVELCSKGEFPYIKSQDYDCFDTDLCLIVSGGEW